MLLSLHSLPVVDPALHTLRSLLVRGRHAEGDRFAQALRRRVAPSDSTGFLAMRAEIALGLGRFACALSWASEALKRIEYPQPSGAGLEGLRIRSLIGLGRFREAETLIEGRYAALDPLGIELGLFRAYVALHSGRLSRASHETETVCSIAASGRQRARLI